MIRHIKISIIGVLNLDNDTIRAMFDEDPLIIRSDLQERLKAGEVYLAAHGCEGFDPVKGCPGHQNPDLTDFRSVGR